MFILKQGKTKFMYFGSTASQAIAKGALVALSSGRLIPAANDTDPSLIVGVIRHAITSASAEYATAGTPVEVEVPIQKNVVWTADVTTDAALTNTDQGEYMDLTTDDTGDAVDTSVSTLDTVQCVGFISATKGLFVLNIGPDYGLNA